MKHRILAVLFAVTTTTGAAHADGQKIRSCDFEVKARCASGDAAVTLVDGVVKRIEVNAFWCGLKGRPGYTCTIDSTPRRQGRQLVGRRRRDGHQQRNAVQSGGARPRQGDGRKVRLHRHGGNSVARPLRRRRGTAAGHRHSGDKRRMPRLARLAMTANITNRGHDSLIIQ